MKKFSLLLVFFIFGCQSLTPQENLFDKLFGGKPQIIETRPLNQKEFKEEEQAQTHDQFESRDLLSIKKSKKIQVALFLPFSGKNKNLGNHLFNSALLSLFENDQNHNIELVLIDSKDNAEDAKKAFAEIIERKIKIVIGPIFTSSVEAIADDARKNKITVISLSNNQELIDNISDDGGIFLAGMLPETQIDKIVTYAMQRGKLSFSVIAPNNQYGMTISNLVKKFVRNRDGNFITAEFYDNNGKNFDKLAQRVIEAFALPAGLAVKKGEVISEANRLYSQVIIIPESGKNLSKIVATIKELNKDERDFQIVGSSQWDDISTLNDSNLFGAWFAAPENEKFRNFEKSYYQSYNQFPPRISSIVYDSLSAISQLVNFKKGELPKLKDFISYTKAPSNLENFSKEILSENEDGECRVYEKIHSNSPSHLRQNSVAKNCKFEGALVYTDQTNSFSGIDGSFRFLPNGLVQRNLAVLQVSSGRFDTIEKPAEKFLKY